MIDFKNKSFVKMKPYDDYAEKVENLLLPDEKVVRAFKSMRDGVVFTDKRIIAVNVQGITGKKRDFTSIPYSKITTYSVETAGTFDLDAELEIYMSAVGSVKFEFTAGSDIVEISNIISRAVL